jgi:hypothetical protein
MRVVAVSMVKDEADVVEAFVRHTAAVVDHHLVFDHGSTDATPSVLDRLRRDGLPLTVLVDDEDGFFQAERTTALVRKAFREHNADWVLPLDADEFIQGVSPAEVRDSLAGWGPSDALPTLDLVNYGPAAGDDESQTNPVLRCVRRDPTPITEKVFVSRAAFADPVARMQNGNHGVVRLGRPVPTRNARPLWLAHFPIRSGLQLAQKIAQHHLQKRAGAIPSGSEHYAPHFARLLASPERFAARPGDYFTASELAPAAYWGTPVRFAVRPPSWAGVTKSLLGIAQSLADELGRARNRANSGGKAKWRSFFARTKTVTWSGECFREAPPPPDSRRAEGLAASLTDAMIRVANDEWSVSVKALNTGPARWRSQPGPGMVRLGVQTADNRDYARCELPHDVEPGDSATLILKCPRPRDRGLGVVVDLVSEGVAWFECGVTPTVVHAESKRAA